MAKEQEKYYEDDRPRNYDKYLKMSPEELDEEIKRLEAEESKKHDRIKREDRKVV